MMTRSLEGHGRAGFLSCHVEICSHLGSQPQKKVKTLLVHTLVRRQVLQPHQNKISNLNISSDHFHFLNLKVKHRFYRQKGTEDSCSNLWTKVQIQVENTAFGVQRSRLQGIVDYFNPNTKPAQV